MKPPFRLDEGRRWPALRTGPHAALILPEGEFSGRIALDADDKDLFAGVYSK